MHSRIHPIKLGFRAKVLSTLFANWRQNTVCFILFHAKAERLDSAFVFSDISTNFDSVLLLSVVFKAKQLRMNDIYFLHLLQSYPSNRNISF